MGPHLLVGAALTAWGLAALPTPPHIITILTDDQGFGDNSYNCENSTGMCAQMPNLDTLATSPHSALFWRFYSAAGVCSPTRASYLTGRTNERSCIHFALTCDSENPAEECSQGPGLPWSEFTTAKAVKKAGGFKSIMIGKWCGQPHVPFAALLAARCYLPYAICSSVASR